MKSLYAAMIAFAFGIVPASAQPIPYSWSGFYIGANVGYGQGDLGTSQNSITTTGPLTGNLPVGSFPSTTFGGADRSSTIDGAFGGLQAGYNWQTGNWVYGIEADYQFADINGTDRYSGSPAGPQYTVPSKLTDFATIRGRLGQTFDRVMFYVTGGVAFGRFDTTVIDQPGTLTAPIGSPHIASTDRWKTGYVVGAGIEWALAQNWSLKAEYLYMDFGAGDMTFVFPNDAGTAFARVENDLHAMKLGVNYRFSGL